MSGGSFVSFASFMVKPPGRCAARGAAVLLSVAATVAMAAGPGGDAEVRRMIDSLRPSAAAGSAPTRSAAPATPASTTRTRNLVIEAATAPASGATPAPSGGASPAPSAATPAQPAAAPSLSLPIVFEPNSAQLRPESGALLGSLVAAMLSTELQNQRFVIEGHTDASGSAAQNLRLSKERAEQVRLYLVTLGVDGERLRAVGKGASEPVNAADPRAAENRRVRVVAAP